MSDLRDDPIVAIATAAGRGGIGVVRLSFGRWTGQPVVAAFVAALCAKPSDFRLTPRHATLVGVHDGAGRVIDRGIALLFAAPHSYTGEDVVELQLHGGPVVLRMVVERCLAVAHGLHDVARMRPAAPGEFTERAFLNDKLDLAQAEAVADLIEAGSEAAVLGAQASLSGAFSVAIRALVDDLIALRALVEATLDFPDEEIDFLEQSDARGRLQAIRTSLAALTRQARRGAVLREGLTVVLAGRPNVGKSSLMNALAETDVAIVTPIAGTTRDRIEQTIRLEGIALHIVDTAGIRTLDDDGGANDDNAVERIGIERTWDAIAKAHVVLHLVDATAPVEAEDEAIVRRLPAHAVRLTVVNKIDLSGDAVRRHEDRLFISAKTGDGIDLLRSELLGIAGWQPGAEVAFLARERHLVAMHEADAHLARAADHADQGDRQLELFAEELRLAQLEFDRITGVFSPDDLLGEIFGRFCIGK